MKKDCIGDFVQAWGDWDNTRPPSAFDWDSRFADAGYYRVNVSVVNILEYNWFGIDEWCKEQFGKTHYFWSTATTVWFESEKDAMLFILRWS
jgi:hypothetical protein